MGLRPLLIVAALAALGTAAIAKTQREVQEEACYGDAMKLCKEFVPDEAKITACMEQKKAQLSPPCAALFNAGN